MKVSQLCEQFIEMANRPMDLGRLPIDPKEPEVPIVPASRWMKNDGGLVKTYAFRRPEDRERFVMQLFDYERQVQHNAEMLIKQGEVTVSVTTHDIGVTELDMEYARFCDALFKDVVYSPDHGNRREDDAGDP